MTQLTTKQFAEMTDLACVKAETTEADIKRMAGLADKYSFAGVYVLPSHNEMLKALLSPSGSTFIGGAVGFPSGGATTSMKVGETKELVEFGCGEIDMVINLTWLKAGRYGQVKDDIAAVVDAAGGLIVKTILEVYHLTGDEIAAGAKIAAEAGASFVKTATGWPDGGATFDNIRLIADALAGTDCRIKAAGGIKDIETASKMVDLGVTRFGCSIDSAAAIVGEQI